ncbi:MAG: UDP-3-O-(3-hydroxymyristoyl)glucosamine N-acyltransferase [Bryobacterales bacterium]|nr:UDP-3-O-(3-hydroxymyristoyl)glucosamine N-acyltransferase [Bryobacterales bacterium]
MKISEIAEWLGAMWEGTDFEATGVASVESAGVGEISFVGGRKAASLAAASQAGCLLAPVDFENGAGRTLIRVKDPRGAFARVVARMAPGRKPVAGIHPTAVIGAGVELGAELSVGPQVTIGDGARIGDGTVIGAGSSIGAGVQMGAGCRLHANVTLYEDVVVGSRCVLHSGCVIGADGFGFVMSGGRYEKFPQVGKVVIGDDVEIGANTCIDRAALGVTAIGDGTKLDNMVHIAHNCRIGKHVVVAAQTGFSGGVVVEDYAVVGGQVGVGDKAVIESKAVVGSGAGILTSKIVRGGQVVWGTPARPLKQYLEQLAIFGKLPEINEELKQLRKRVEELSGAGGSGRA